MRSLWNDEKLARLKELYATTPLSSAEITQTINSEYGTLHSTASVVYQASINKMQREVRSRVWSPEKDAILARCIGQKKSFSQTAQEMGVTRNAISGRATKLGLKIPMEEMLQERAFAKAMRDRTKQETRYAVRMAELLHWVPGKYKQAIPFKATPEVVSNPRNLTLAEVSVNQCRWIMNDDTAAPLYCGHATARKESSWCAKHAGVVFEPPDWRDRYAGSPKYVEWYANEGPESIRSREQIEQEREQTRAMRMRQ